MLKRNNIEKIIQEANALSNDVMAMAQLEGILNEFERLPPDSY